jgi:type IV secretion system protein VirD4
LIGFDGLRPLWYCGLGGALLVAGARSGKLRDVLAYNICAGICLHSALVLDLKGELAAISQNQTADAKFCIFWNPAALHGLPCHRINPVDYLRKDSRTLVSDTKLFAENMIPHSGSPQARYFEGRAREVLEGVTLTLVHLNNVLTFPDLFRTINLLISGGEAWLDFAFEMTECGFAIAGRIEDEIASAKKDSSGGFKGILGELTRAVSCLSDPLLLDSVSPPFTFSMDDLCDGQRAYQVYLMPPAEFAEAWAPVIKALFVAGMVYKSRSPSAPRQTWVLDELPQLGAFPLAVKLYSYGAGIGIRPWGVVQSLKQLKALGPDAETIIPASAALQCYFGVRDLDTASTLSRMIGNETLEHIDRHRRAAALHASQQAVQALLRGGDPFRAGMEIAHHGQVANLPVLTQRPLRDPAEILGMPPDKQVIFTDGVSHAIWADRRAYYDQPFMAGRYHPNPYHGPPDRLKVRTTHGYAWRRVIVEPVPPRFAPYPQYADGTWSRIG